MERIRLAFCLFALLFCSAFSQMTEEKRKKLYSKVVKRIDISKPNDFIVPLNDIYGLEEIKYDSNKIKQIISENNFPESYNFFDATNVQKRVKDQERCGCCWAFASSTALGYRYAKAGYDVDLSPQNMLSCYIRDCELGGYMLDSHFYLVKNGTTTESCVPYSSADGKTIESCPTKCKGNEEYKKYYAINSYATNFDFYDQETYYDVVTVIMDQLVNYGPVSSGILCYQDLPALGQKSTCKDTIYKYDKESDYMSGHAVTIVGYGNKGSQYYWIAQNSWGKDFCDDGLVKIEFNEIGIENVAFSDPYFETETSESKTITAKMKLEEDCKISYTTDSNNYDDNFELNFKAQNSDNNFYYQCGKDPKEERGICSFSFETFNNNGIGYYQYNNHSPLRTNNKISLNLDSFDQKRFNYYGGDYISYIYLDDGENYYVSGEGSEITLLYSSNSQNVNSNLNIYPNENTQTSLKNCKVSNVEIDKGYYLLKCKLTQNEVDSIGENKKNETLVYDVLCGDKQNIGAVVHKFDKTKYPIFRVKKLVLPKEEKLGNDYYLTMIASIEGSVSGMKGLKNDGNCFSQFIRIKGNNQYEYLDMGCCAPIPENLEEDFEIGCEVFSGESISYSSIEVIPYYNNFYSISPYEVIFNDNIQVVDYYDYFDDDYINPIRRSESKFIESSLLILSLLALAN